MDGGRLMDAMLNPVGQSLRGSLCVCCQFLLSSLSHTSFLIGQSYTSVSSTFCYSRLITHFSLSCSFCLYLTVFSLFLSNSISLSRSLSSLSISGHIDLVIGHASCTSPFWSTGEGMGFSCQVKSKCFSFIKPGRNPLNS